VKQARRTGCLLCLVGGAMRDTAGGERDDK
jgi:hypothetical protein